MIFIDFVTTLQFIKWLIIQLLKNITISTWIECHYNNLNVIFVIIRIRKMNRNKNKNKNKNKKNE